MGRLILFIILAFSALAVRAVVVTISASDSSVGLSPLGSWSEGQERPLPSEIPL